VLARFITTIKHFDPVLVILDTMARCLVGGDENSAKDVGMFIEGCDEIRRQTGAAVMVVHHTGKSGNYRGSSALYGGCDSWIDFANDDGLITVSCGKAKDWKKFEPRYLRMVETRESVVLLPAEQVSQRGAKITEGQRKVLETLALDVFQGPGAKAAQIMSSTGIPEKTLFRILSRLKRDGMIGQGNRGDPYTITHNGLTEIKTYHRALRESRETEQTLDIAQPNALLSRLSPTVTTDSDTTVTSVTPPYIYKGVTVQGGVGVGAPVMGSGWREVELFPEEPQPTEVKNYMALDWEYLRQCYEAKDMAGISRHCAMRQVDPETVLSRIEQELGVTPESYDENE
jgi:predicted transcriptional regulator